MFKVVSLTALHLNVQFLEETGSADASPYDAHKQCSRWMKYFSFHALDPLGVFLCSNRLIPEVFRVALQDLCVVKFQDIFIWIIIWMLHGLEYMNSDLVSLDSQFKLTFLHIDLRLSRGQEGSTQKNFKKSLGCLPSSALFKVVSLTALHLNVRFLEETGSADASPYDAHKQCSRWMKYFSFHALDPLGVFLCSNRLIPEVFRVALQDLCVVKFQDIFIWIIIWMLHGLEYINSDLVSLDSQFKLTFLHIDLRLSRGQEGSTKYDGN